MGSDREKVVDELSELRRGYLNRKIEGERRCIFSEGKEIDLIVYRPDTAKKNLPCLIEVHGGAWVAGDAVLMNSFCRMIADSTPAVVINLNYKKLDQQPFPYQQEELAATVSWIKGQAEEMGVNQERIFICGQSAGGHICGTGAILMKQKGISICRQILVYPTTDYAALAELKDDSGLNLLPEQQHNMFFPDYPIDTDLISPMHTAHDYVKGVAPATIIVCGQDVLKNMGVEYAGWLKEAGVKADLVEYPDAKHGFLETNREEYGDWPDNSPEQAVMAHECEKLLVKILKEEIADEL